MKHTLSVLVEDQSGALSRISGLFARRGFNIERKQKVLIVEDVITTGKSSLECSKLVSKVGAKIIGYACIIDRSNGKSKIKSKILSHIKIQIPTFKKNNLPDHLKKIKPTKPGSRNI